MTTSLSTTVKLVLSWIHKNALDLGEVKDANSLVLEDTLADGIALDEADAIWHDRRTLAAGANDDLDLAGALADAFGKTLTFARIKAIAIQNRTATAGVNLEIGGGDDGAGNNAFASWLGDASDKLQVGPEGGLLLWNPSLAAYAVTAGTGDILRIHNASGSDSAEYDIVLVGASG